MTRILDPISGEVINVDDSVAPLVEELWARLGQPGAVLPARTPATPEPVARAKVAARRRPDRLIVPWQPAELAKVRDGLPGRYRLTCDLGASLGLRQGELFGFNLDDLGQRAYRVRVQIKRVDGVLVFAPPKHERERSVPVPASLRELVTAHTAEHGTARVTLPWIEPQGRPRTLTLAFTNQHAAPLGRAYMNRLWRTAVVAAGIAWIPQDTGMHMLRHVAASRWIGAGGDVLMVRDLLGHADTTTTERYMHRLKTHDQRTSRVVARAQPRASRPAKLPAGVASLDAWRIRKTS
jgi:integrase